MNRRVLAVLVSSALMLIASGAPASPPPLVTFVLHNNTGETLTNVIASFRYVTSNVSGIPQFNVGTVANGATARVDLRQNFERSQLQDVMVRFTGARGEDYRRVSAIPNGIAADSWGRWLCNNCDGPNYMIQWTDYTINFTLQKR